MAEPSLSFPTEFPYELDTLGSNSPVGSVLSSTADDGFFVGLAQQLAWTSLSQTQKSVSPCFNLKKFELKMSSEEIPYHNNDHLIRRFLGVPPSISVNSTSNLDYGLFSNAFQMQKVRENLVLQVLCASSWRRQAPPSRKPEIPVAVGARCGVSYSPWLPPPLNQPSQPNTSAVRCIHPGGSGVKRVSSGTGVFLPRRHLNPSDCRQKRGIPANRFAEEIINYNQAPLNHCQLPGFDSISSRRNNPVLPMPRSFRAEVNQELHLPQEWTY